MKKTEDDKDLMEDLNALDHALLALEYRINRSFKRIAPSMLLFFLSASAFVALSLAVAIILRLGPLDILNVGVISSPIEAEKIYPEGDPLRAIREARESYLFLDSVRLLSRPSILRPYEHKMSDHEK